MAYESERIAPLPPLREACLGEGAPADVTACSETDGDSTGTKSAATPVESSATRNGGADFHPKVNAPREIRIDRTPDVREGPAAPDARQEGAPVGRGRALVPMFVWTILALAGLWLYCQVIPLVTFAIGCRGWRMWAAFSLLAIPVALVGLVVRYALRVFRGLPSMPQERDLPGREFAVKERLLLRYVERLPASNEYAERAGFDDSRREEVVALLDRLRDDAGARHYSDEVGWLDDFRRFQALQRERANGIVGRYCKLIGLKTAASPWKIVDVICVFLNSTLMVVELAALYNRRVDRGAAFRLVFRWFLNIYISGELGQVSESAAGFVGERLKEPVRESLSGLDWMDGDWAGTVAQSMPFLAKVAGKAVEGGVNAYFAWRMGRRAVAAFEPLAPADAPGVV